MSVLGTILRGASESRAISFLGAPSGDLESALLGGSPTRTGRAVTPESALRVASVYAAVRILAEAVRICPMQVLRPEEGRHVRATDSRLWPLVNVAPNPEIPASEMWELLTGHLAVHGNAFIFKERDATGRVVAFWPLMPQQVMVGRLNREKVYALYPWTVAGEPPYVLPPIGTARDIIHLRWFGVNGLVGLSPIRQLQEDVALEDGQGEFAGNIVANDARPGGVLQTDGEITSEAANRLLARWNAAHQGGANRGKVAVLENGVKWQQTTMSLVDAQFVSQRNMSIQAIARGWRIPASMFLAEAGSSLTYSSTEQEGRGFLAYTLQPILDRLAAPLTADPDLQLETGLRFGFDTDTILNVQTLDRIRGTALQVATGILSRNDARAIEGLGRVDGLDTYTDPQVKTTMRGDLAAETVQQILLDATGANGNGKSNGGASTAEEVVAP